jgi:hypothetical protein
MKKQKFKSAEHKRAAIEAERYQEEMYKRWGISDTKRKPSTKTYNPNYSHRSTDNRPSSVGISGGTCGKKDSPKYTGTLVIGISTLHKSNAVPIINQEQATEIAQMRRG